MVKSVSLESIIDFLYSNKSEAKEFYLKLIFTQKWTATKWNKYISWDSYNFYADIVQTIFG